MSKTAGVAVAAFVLSVLAIPARADGPAGLDPIIQRVRSAEALSDQDRDRCNSIMAAYSEELLQKHGCARVDQLPEPDRSRFYVSAVKAAIIDPVNHGGWPFRSDLRLRVLTGLKEMIKQNDDPFLLFCAVFPAVEQNDVPFAAAAYEALRQRDDFLANLTVDWTVKPKSCTRPQWLVAYYLAAGKQDKALGFAAAAAATQRPDGFNLQASLYIHLGDLAKAEACYKEAVARLGCVDWLVAFYEDFADKKDASGVSFRQRLSEYTKQCFPNGLCKVELRDFVTAPTNGLVFTEESDVMLDYGIRKKMVLCAVDGYRVENTVQYLFVRHFDVSNPIMRLIIWNGAQYVERSVELVGRAWGAGSDMVDYVP